MEKAHSRIKWENYPSIATPLNETNLNKMDIALDEVDNRVLGLDTAKLDKAVANSMVKEITFDEATGIFTITSLDGTTKTVDTKLEKVATNFSYDYETQKLKLTLLDGTEQEIDMSTLISQYEFTDTSTIGFTVGNEGKITANVKDGSITENKLQPNFLADVKVEVAKAKSSSDSAYDNATASLNASTQAKQYRDEAEQFRNEAENFTPSGYAEIVEQVNENTFKIDTVIEKANLGIKNTANGKEIHLVDSAEGKIIETTLYGESKQKQYSGKNLWSLGDVSGTHYVTKNISLDAGTYTVSALVTSSDTDSTQSGIVCNYDDGSTVALQFNRNTRVAKTVTFTKSVVSMSLYASNNYANSANDTFTWSDIQIEQGSTMTEYEPFVGNQPSPSPSYPQEIESVVVSEIKSVGKNFYDNISNFVSSSHSGVNVSKGVDDTFNVSGKATAFVNNIQKTFSLPKGKYIVSRKEKENKLVGLALYNKTNSTFITSSITYEGVSFEIEEDSSFDIRIQVASGSEVNVTGQAIMIRLATETNGTYEPYKESKVTLSAPITLRGIGNVKDVLCKQDGVYGVLRKIGSIVLNGLENWQKGTRIADTTYSRYYLTGTGVKTIQQCLCSHLLHYSVIGANPSGYYEDVERLCAGESVGIDVVVNIPTTSEWKAILASNPMTIDYPLATPTFEPLPEADNEQIENLSTFYPITNISNNSNCEMSVKYNCDSKNYIDNKLSEIATAMTNNI